ncbi:hypothetical protein ACIBSW_24545 [Actinoplanes sp. NPDC049668]|uniref:hypothetical protein n=1 Tax=unclassified Actinoplanes TaxID=2626549 RepID=UPI0033AD4889
MSDMALHARALRRLRRMHSVRQVVVRLDRPARAISRAMRRGPAATARFAAVLDGRTLNVEFPVPGRAADVRSAELRVVRGRTVRCVPVRVRRDSDDSCSLSATVLLTDGPGGLDLRPGSPWLLEAVVHSSAGTTSYAVLAGEPGTTAAGPTLAAPPDAVTGRRYQVGGTRSGRLCLAVNGPAPTAEVAAIDVGWLGARVRVRLLGCEGPVTAVEFVARTGEGRVHAAAVATGDGAQWDVPAHELALMGGAKETFFDVYLRAGTRRLRPGRYLHDVVNPKPVLVPPAGIVWVAPGLSVSVRPYYTPAGNLTVACRPIGLLSSNGES